LQLGRRQDIRDVKMRKLSLTNVEDSIWRFKGFINMTPSMMSTSWILNILKHLSLVFHEWVWNMNVMIKIVWKYSLSDRSRKCNGVWRSLNRNNTNVDWRHVASYRHSSCDLGHVGAFASACRRSINVLDVLGHPSLGCTPIMRLFKARFRARRCIICRTSCYCLKNILLLS
jgi:hypothetical protein